MPRANDSLTTKIKTTCHRELGILAKAGWDRKWILSSLVLVAEDARRMADRMRERQSELKRFAKKLKKLRAEMVELDGGKLYHSLFGAFGGVATWWWPHKLPGSKALEAEKLRQMENDFVSEAKDLGRFLRTTGRIDTAVVIFLAECWSRNPALWSNDKKRLSPRLSHLDVFARLLTDVMEFAGRPTSFTAGRLRVMFVRHGQIPVAKLREQ